MTPTTVNLPALREGDYLSAAGETHRGMIKKLNQDRVLMLGPGVPVVEERGGGYLFGVIDGMGSRKGGEISADITQTTLFEYYRKPDGAGPDRIEALLHEANRRVCERQAADMELFNMACVVSLAWTTEDRIELFHVGDTRIYGVNGTGLVQLTEDHNDRIGKITDYIGNPRGLGIDRHTLDPDDWDLLLICSDGLPLEVPDARIVEIVQEHEDAPDRVVQGLLQAALIAGGRDNVTVVCVAVG